MLASHTGREASCIGAPSYMKSDGKEAFREIALCLNKRTRRTSTFSNSTGGSSMSQYKKLMTDVRIYPAPVSVRGVSITARRIGREWLIVLVNEDEHAHMGIEVTGLDALNGTEFVELYGEEKTIISEGAFVTRLRSFEVKLFATHRKWEDHTTGRAEILPNNGRERFGFDAPKHKPIEESIRWAAEKRIQIY